MSFPAAVPPRTSPIRRSASAWGVAALLVLGGCGANEDGGGGPVVPAAGAGGSGGNSGTNAGGSSSTAGQSPSGGGGSSGSSGSSPTGGAGAAGQAGTGGEGHAGSGGSGGGGGGGGPPGAKFVGNITTRGAVRDGFSKYWDQITPENEGKWGSVEATRGKPDWSRLDPIYKYTQDNQIAFKQHVFVWGSQQPSWLAGLSGADQTAAVKNWMSTFCARYPNVKYIDVVNEPPPHTTPSYMNGIGGTGASGWDWIVNAFKWAREACPNAVLILNDYNDIEYPNDNQHMIDIVTAIRKAGAPIDAIGAQAHDAYKLPTATVKGYIDKLAATGLPVFITEYDIGIANDDEQKRVMQEQFTMFYTHPSIHGITLWGYIVGATWRDNTGLQQSNGTMRPAMTWLMQYLKRPTN
ncbi:MAG TPA: endo-1,4-beta-xylanase [Polyangiaceae bacterium]|nr:endo-1,4-beta-xylanase [Polyangiaceae bacterium]